MPYDPNQQQSYYQPSAGAQYPNPAPPGGYPPPDAQMSYPPPGAPPMGYGYPQPGYPGAPGMNVAPSPQIIYTTHPNDHKDSDGGVGQAVACCGLGAVLCCCCDMIC